MGSLHICFTANIQSILQKLATPALHIRCDMYGYLHNKENRACQLASLVLHDGQPSSLDAYNATKLQNAVNSRKVDEVYVDPQISSE